MATPNEPIVVGIDGSEDAVTAARWAVAEAGRRAARLLLVIVNDDPAREDHAENAVHDVAEKCRALQPDLDVETEVARGRPVEELLRRSESAGLVVLGKRGRGGFAEALLGGVSSAVAAHGACPVVVVPESASANEGHVVAGVDGSEPSTDALRFAFQEAERSRADLMAVEMWHEEGLLAVPLPPVDRRRVEHELERGLADQVSAVSGEFPGVHVRRVVQRGHPVASLIDLGREAQLLVVGHRGRGGFDGLFLGSVALGVLHHARCPVAVVRSAATTS